MRLFVKSLELVLFAFTESWVEVNGTQVMGTPVHMLTRSGTHSFRSLERLLSEAQKESNQSSFGGSARNSHSISPKSAQSPVFTTESLSPNESMILSKVGPLFFELIKYFNSY